MSNLLKKALIATMEELNPDTEYEAQVTDPELVIPDAGSNDEEPSVGETFDQLIEADELADSLEAIAAMAEEFAKNGTASAQTAALIQASVESLLSPYGLSMPFEQASMESLETDFVRFHEVSCEGIREFVVRLKENVKSGWKSFKDDFMYNLKTRNEKLIQLDRRLREVKSFISKRKVDLKKTQYRFEYGGLVKLFRVNDEVQTDFGAAIESDHKFLEELLGKYQGEIIHSMNELASAFSGSTGIHDAVERVAKIKHPARHVSSNIVSGHPMMGNWGLRFKEGKRIKSIMLGELGFNSSLYLDMSMKQFGRDIIRAIVFGQAAAIAESAMNAAQMTPESLEKSVATLDSYVKMIRNSLTNSHKTIEAADKIWQGFEKLKEDGGSPTELKALETAARWFIANSDRPFDGLINHAFVVMGYVISFTEQLSRRLK